jgi:serine/threonine protein kinase
VCSGLVVSRKSSPARTATDGMLLADHAHGDWHHQLVRQPGHVMALNAGARLGPYEIVGRVGASGMGEVWKARDTRLDRTVAIKVLPPDLTHRAGIIHRDLKPGNVILTKAGATLLDFSLAKLRPHAVDGQTATTAEPLTGHGTILGPLQYMARTDIFS